MVKAMKQIINKRNYIILGIIIILFIFILLQTKNKAIEYSYSYEYFDHYIIVKIYEDNNVSEEIDEIYQQYEDVLNGKNDQLLDEIITYGQEIYQQTDGYVDISKGQLTSGQITEFETKIDTLTIKDIEDIDLTDIISSYATGEVIDYLKKNNIEKYLISDNGDISVGEYYTSGNYKSSILYDGEVLEIVSLENKSMITRSNDDETKSYMVNPIESKVTKKYDTVVVITDDVNEATMLANAVYLMNREDGEKLIENYQATALWYINGEIYTINFDKYIGD